MPHFSDRATVIIDISDGEVFYVGFAGDDNPRVFRPAWKSTVIRNGVVVDWNQLELGLRDAFKALRVAPSEHPLIILDAPINPRLNRGKLTTLALQRLKVPAFSVINSAVAALKATKRTTGIVLLMGEGGSFAAAVVKGKPLLRSYQHSGVNGKLLDEHFRTLSKSGGLKLEAGSEQEIVRDIKEKLAYVALDYEDELEKAETSSDIEQNYELPDGQVITVGAERFRGPEVLFKPNLIGLEQDGVHTTTYNSIMKCGESIRADLYSNVVMSGGTTMFPGIDERLAKEIKQLAPDSMTIKIIAPPERKYSVWIGGSILSSLSTFEEMWISKNEYDEAGPSIVHRKCT